MTSNTTQGAPISDGFALTRLQERVAELEAERRELIEELCGSDVPQWQLDAPSFRYVEVQVDKQAWLKWRAEWEAK